MRRGAALTAVVGVAGFVAFAARSLAQQVDTPIIRPWVASQYWLDYRDGLVRRGLPGAVLRLVSGGRPSGTTVTWVGVGLTVTASLVLLAVAVRVARGATAHRLLLFGALLVSPVTFGHLLRDIGRYDTIVVLALGFFALVPRPGAWRSPIAAAVLGGAVLVVAGGTQELAVGFVLPVAYVWFAWSGERVAPFLAPGLAVSMLSIVARPSAALVEAVIADGKAEDVGLTTTPNTNAVVVLRNGLREQVAFVFDHSTTQMIQSFLVFVLLFAAVALLLHRLVAPTRRLVGLALAQAAVATALCVIGVDYRRWWMLATIGLLCGALHVVPHDDDAPSVAPALRPMAVAACMVVFAALQEVPTESNWFPDTLRNYLT